MGNLFIEYMSKKSNRKNIEERVKGPVITISREYGCYATEIAKLLSERLTRLSSNQWDYITKEILEESANKLKVSEKEIAHLFGANAKGFFGNLIMSFGGNKYKSESIVINTINNVVRTFCEQGNVVLVGRAGCTIAKLIDFALHVRIIAPFDYRLETIKTRFKLSEQDAIKKVQEIDRDRKKFMGFFKEQRNDDEIFDLFLNRSKMSTEEIVDTIIGAAKARKMC